MNNKDPIQEKMFGKSKILLSHVDTDAFGSRRASGFFAQATPKSFNPNYYTS